MSELSINTTQNVVIKFSAASVGERMGAYALDLVIKIAYLFTVFYIFYWLKLDRIFGGDRWAIMSVMMILALPYVFYSLVLETLFEGQTLGKKICKIKVVKIDGYQASFGDYIIRWLFRLIDFISSSGLVGLTAMIISEKTQRLGDMASGTAVITLKNKITINSTILEEIGDAYVPVYPLVIRLSDNDIRIIKETYQTTLVQKKIDFEILGKLKDKIESVTGITKQSGTTNEEFIKTILKDYNFYTQHM
ncbi:RDD family protein [Flavobacterium sp. ARAG 55.4]|uniref:RDD family protein n=1 Tax=Flavobacterium sp. ARAG 55.4 TaxID=3451357 RepID=UPI003F469F3F